LISRFCVWVESAGSLTLLRLISNSFANLVCNTQNYSLSSVDCPYSTPSANLSEVFLTSSSAVRAMLWIWYLTLSKLSPLEQMTEVLCLIHLMSKIPCFSYVSQLITLLTIELAQIIVDMSWDYLASELTYNLIDKIRSQLSALEISIVSDSNFE
jgi:hypothetical protein